MDNNIFMREIKSFCSSGYRIAISTIIGYVESDSGRYLDDLTVASHNFAAHPSHGQILQKSFLGMRFKEIPQDI